MTNPYHISYIFGDSISVGELQGNGNRNLLTLTFKINDSGNDAAYLASDHGLKLLKQPTIKLDYDFDEFFMVPAECDFQVYDENDELDALLYSGPLVEKVSKDFFVKFEVKYGPLSPNGATADYIERFSGYNIVENLDEHHIYKTHIFTALPRTNILNETLIFARDWDATKFDADQVNTYPNNPLNLVVHKVGAASKWNWIKLTDPVNGGIIEKIFQLINPAINISIIQNWLFYGSTRPEFTEDPNQALTNNTLTFSDLICDGNWIGSLFAEDKHSEIKSVGDLLKLLAFEFGCMACIQTQNKALFRQLYYFNENDLQLLGTEIDDSYHKKYKYTKIDFARVQCSFYKQDTGQSNRYVEQSYRPIGYSPAINLEKNSGDNGLEKTITTVINAKQNAGGFDIGASISNLKAAITGVPSQYYSIFGVKNPFVDFTPIVFSYDLPIGFLPLTVSLSEYNYNLKGLLYKTRVHEWEFEGVDYDLSKGFQKDGKNFSIVSLEENHETGLTKIGAIEIKNVSITGGDGSTGITITNPLSILPMNSYSVEAGFQYTQLASEDITIATMNENDWLEGFYINTEVIFQPGTITVFTIYDGNEQLLTINNIMGKLTQIVKPQTITKVKKYTAADTLFLHIETNGATQGQGQILIRKMKREGT